MRTFTLVPVGGLGNRLHAISSAISYCQKKDIFLTILWFKDKGLNCNYKELFSIIPSIQNVAIQDNGWLDLLLRDNPRKRNFYIPRFFEKRMYEKCIYYYDDDFHVHDSNPELDDTLDGYDSVYMVTCSDYWQFPVPNNWMKVTDEIENRVLTVEKEFGENTIGVHIRRTDNWNTIKNSPLSLYTDAIDAEISRDSSVRVFLATDSLEEKEKLYLYHKHNL